MSTRRLLSVAAFLAAAVIVRADTFTVMNGDDAGPGSLRQAINDNNATAGGNTIVFTSFFLPFINVSSANGELKITKNVTIAGPGAKSLEINGMDATRIFNISGGVSATISGLSIVHAKSSGVGGGILCAGSLTLTNCQLMNNAAPGSSGGALYGIGFGSSLTLIGCTIAKNSAEYAGGVGADGSLSMTNCTISGNTAEGNTAQGGGVGTLETLIVQSCTISGNQAGKQGGGIYVAGGTVTIGNSIVSDNSAPAGPNVFGTVSSQGYNLVNNTAGSAGFTAFGDQPGVSSAYLGSLQDNGGPTLTMAPRPRAGSTAIDQGKSNLTTDQRGFPRPVNQPDYNNANGGDGSDIGAVEIGHVQSGPAFVVNTSAGTESFCTEEDCSLLSAVGAADQLMGATTKTITFSPDLTGRTITLSDAPYISQPMTITGPGDRNSGFLVGITIDGSNKYSIDLESPPFSGEFAISNLQLISMRTAIISSGHTVRATNCWFDRNSGPEAGAIFNGNADLILTNCLFTRNQATTTGGGAIESLSASGPASVTATNCTFLVNSAAQAGGAIWTRATTSTSAATATIHNCTFANNSAAANSGADIAQALTGGTSVVNLANNIFAHSTGGSLSTNAPINSQGHNLSMDAVSGNAGTGPGGFLDGPGDIRNTDPKLDADYGYNGGFPPTIALLTGSPAINHGNDNLAPATDARGYARVSVSDIGAFEFGSSGPPTPTPTPSPTPTATPTAPPTTLANISTRLSVQTGDNALIGGFIITGTQPKKVIIRAIGPSLPFAGRLANPTLELYSGSTLLASNNDWQNQPTVDRQAVVNSTIPPSNNLEAALVRTLPANNAGYTAIVRGANNGIGIGVVEAYDLDRAANSKLANISTRGLVQTGDNVLIAGTIILGQAPQKVIIRAIGPSLSLPGKLADPTLQLVDGNGAILEENDNWVDSPNKQAIIDSTIPPSNNKESAIVRTLPANGAQYTAIVRGVNNTTGIAVVEIYALQ